MMRLGQINVRFGDHYPIEPGVSGFLLKVSRIASVEHAGKVMTYITIEPGVPHLFTEEVLGPTLPRIGRGEGRFATKWFGAGDGLTLVSALPAVVRDRYLLNGIDIVGVKVG